VVTYPEAKSSAILLWNQPTIICKSSLLKINIPQSWWWIAQ